MEDEKMKRLIAIMIAMLILIPALVLADQVSDEMVQLKDANVKTVQVDGKWLENRAKVGIAIGKPWGLVFGYHFTETFEGNILVGSNLNIDGLTVGGNGLFTLVNFKVGDTIMPFSVGPAVYLNFFDNLNMDALGVARLEYTFDAPVNIYLEGGVGINILQDVELAWTAAVGVRYVFL
jgi:hypothetical protein